MMHVKSDKQHQAEDDVRTLIKAGEIKANEPRYNASMAYAKKQQEAMAYEGMDMGKMGAMSYDAYSKARKGSYKNGKMMMGGKNYSNNGYSL